MVDITVSIIFMACCLFLPFLIPTEEEHVKIPKPIREYEPKIKYDKKIFEDCLSSLLTLGVKKSEAKNKVDSMFNRKKYESVEDFIMDVYRT